MTANITLFNSKPFFRLRARTDRQAEGMVPQLMKTGHNDGFKSTKSAVSA